MTSIFGVRQKPRRIGLLLCQSFWMAKMHGSITLETAENSSQRFIRELQRNPGLKPQPSVSLSMSMAGARLQGFFRVPGSVTTLRFGLDTLKTIKRGIF